MPAKDRGLSSVCPAVSHELSARLVSNKATALSLRKTNNPECNCFDELKYCVMFVLYCHPVLHVLFSRAKPLHQQHYLSV